MLTSGIIGLPMSGKTTVFNLVTGAGVQTSRYLSGRADTNAAAAAVPDQRVDFLSALYAPRKTTYAQVQFSDVPGLVKGASKGEGVGNQFLEGIRSADLLVHVVRAFEAGDVIHVDGSIDPVRDVETVDLELLLSDMALLGRRIRRIEGGKKITRENETETELIRRCLSSLENAVALQDVDLTADERATFQTFNLLTEKPVVLAVNIDEAQLKACSYPGKDRLDELAAERGLRMIEVCGRAEMEIAQLRAGDRELFMADLGIDKLGVDRLIQAAYETLGLISFFTVGADEVRAWTVGRGTDARRAAGKIHTDIERGFIRAEVTRYSDLAGLGSMVKVKEKGLARLEGKDYVVQDGDIIDFRFNV
ncbi:MAG: redox-regulated ATPase YchF [Bacillota bacterium]|nr:redox-regulated ATPase YchF [Bacillota bacterium]